MNRYEQSRQTKLSGVKLSNHENTVSGVCRKYLENNAKLIDDISAFKISFERDIKSNVGHGISEHTSKKVIMAAKRCNSKTSVLMFLSSYMLAGDGLKVG